MSGSKTQTGSPAALSQSSLLEDCITWAQVVQECMGPQPAPAPVPAYVLPSAAIRSSSGVVSRINLRKRRSSPKPSKLEEFVKKNPVGFYRRFHRLLKINLRRFFRKRVGEPHTKFTRFLITVHQLWGAHRPHDVWARPEFSGSGEWMYARMAQYIPQRPRDPPGKAVATSRRQVKKPAPEQGDVPPYSPEDWDFESQIFKPEWQGPPRNPHLARLLSFALLAKRVVRVSSFRAAQLKVVLDAYLYGTPIRSTKTSTAVFRYKAVNQMGDEDAHKTSPEASTSEDMAGNVCLVDQRECSAGETKIVFVPPGLSHGDAPSDHEGLLDRWIPLSTKEWNSTQQTNTILEEFSLPSALLDKRANSANATLFKNYMYCRPEFIDVKVLVNANKFQVGQLQVAWLYDTIADSNIAHRKHVCTLSQTMNVLANAGSSNPACLTIAYRSPYSMLPTTTREDDGVCLHMGTLYITVLNQLQATSTVDNKCSFTTYVKFRNTKFAGMKARDLGTYATPQMDIATAIVATNAAEKLISSFRSDNNRDNPSFVQARTPMVPQGVQSLSAGTGSVDVINHMRLDPRGATAHFDEIDEMPVDAIAQRYGLIATHKWSKNNKEFDMLFGYDASPMFDQSEYQQTTVQSNNVYYIPPVAVISSLFAQWRGCLKMRVDIVKNQFYTGRLMVSYIPREVKEPTYDQALSSPYMIFDIAEEDSFEFEIPFITNRFAWPRRMGYVRATDKIQPPGRVWVFVQNPLIVMDNVPDSIELNIYWAAGGGFEVGIPSQPSIGTVFWTTDDNPDKEIKAYGGYYPWYWGYYGDFYNGKKAIARYGKGWQHVAQFQNLDYHSYYTANTKYINAIPKMYKNDGSEFQPQYFVAVDTGDFDPPRYLAVVETLELALKYAKGAKPDFSLCMDVANNDDGPWCAGNPIFDKHKQNTTVDDFVVVANNQAGGSKGPVDERDRRIETSCHLVPCPAPAQGKLIWGELFTSLKDVCRRYQPYCVWQGSTTSQLGDVTFSFPVVPQGLDLKIEAMEKSGNYYQKFIREGTIPIVSSGYRFFRGSIRFQMIITPTKDLNVWVQHRPDYQPDKWEAQAPSTSKGAENLINTGYSVYLQTTRVNNVLSFEVPFYQCFFATYLQRSNLKKDYVRRAGSLGTLYIGIEGAGAKVGVSAVVFYALGDDANFQVFQGFPPMLFLDSIPDPQSSVAHGVVHHARNEMGLLKDIKNVVKKDDPVGAFQLSESADTVAAAVSSGVATLVEPGITHNINLSDPPPIKVEHSLNLSSLWGKSKKQTVSSDEEQPESSIPPSNDRTLYFPFTLAGDKGYDVMDKVLGTLGAAAKNFASDVLINIGHLLINPSIKGLCFAVVAILVKIGIINASAIMTMFKALWKYLKSIGAKIYKENGEIIPDETPSVPHAATVPETTSSQGNHYVAVNQSGLLDESELISFCGVAFTAVSQAVDMTLSPPKSLAEWGKCLTKGFSQNIRGGTFFQTFLTNNLNLFKKIHTYIVCKMNKENLFEKLAEEELHPIVEWCEEVETILDTKEEDKTYSKDSIWATRVEYAYVVGQKLHKNFAIYSKGRSNMLQAFRLFSSLYDKLLIKRENMYKRGISSVCRREPFCIFLAGPSGCGKSQVLNDLIPYLLKKGDIRYIGEATYIHQNGSKYWTGCRNQPACQIDDFLNIQTGELLQQGLSDFWSIKSPVALNPPQAHLDDKERRYAPEILGVASNYSFFKIPQVDMDAVHRRREVLVECELVPKLREKISNLNNMEARQKAILDLHISLANWEHIQFRIAHDPMNPHTKFSKWMTYSELKQKAGDLFIQYRAEQMAIYERNMKRYKDMIDELGDDDEHLSLLDKRNQYKRSCRLMAISRPHPDYTFKEYLKLVSMYANNEISMEKLAAMKEIVLDDHKRRSAQSENATLVWPLDHKPEDIPNSHSKDIIADQLRVQWDVVKPADPVYQTILIALLAENLDCSTWVKQPLPIEGITRNIAWFNPRIGVSSWPSTSGETYAFVHKKCYKMLKNCKCEEMFTELYSALPQIPSKLFEERMCVHNKFASDNIFMSNSDPTKSYFIAEDDTRIPEEPCEGYCLWNEPLRRHADNKAWLTYNKHKADGPVEVLPIYCQSIVRDKLEVLSRVDFVDKIKLKDKPIPEVVKEITKTGVTDKKEKSWAYRYATEVGKFFLKALVWIAPVLAFIGGMAAIAWMFGFDVKNAAYNAAVFSGILKAGEYTDTKVFNRQAKKIDEAVTIIHKASEAFSENASKYSGTTSKAVVKGAKPKPMIFAKNQNGFNEHQNVVVQTIAKNTYFVVPLNSRLADMRIVAMYENYFIMPWHYVRSLQVNNVEFIRIISAVNKDFKLDIRVDSLEPKHYDDRDLALVRIKAMPNCKNLAKFVMKLEDHEKPHGMCHILECSPTTTFVHAVSAELGSSISISGTYNTDLNNVYSYKWGGSGKCGSLLVNLQSNRPIIGIHIAGDGYMGFAEPLSADGFSEAVDVPVSAGVTEVAHPDHRLEGAYIPVGYSDDGLAHNQSGETQNVPSLLHGLFPVVTAPNPLAQGDKRVPVPNYSPLWAGCANMTKPVGQFPEELVRPVAEAMKQRLLALCKPTLSKVGAHSIPTAVVGLPGVPYYDGLDMNTSEGFPLSRYRPGGVSNKRWLFSIEGNPPELKGIHEYLIGIITAKNRVRARGDIPMTIFDDCLKDARLPIEKCKIPGKTRIFSTSPVDYTIVMKQFFFDFQAAFKTHRITLSHAIGINPTGPEWAQLARALQSKGTHFITGDYSNFGPSLSHQILWEVVELLLAWYDLYQTDRDMLPRDQNIRRSLLYETIHACHLTHDYVWQAVSGIPSGCPITVEINSLVNEFYIGMAWIDIMKSHAYDRMIDVFYASTKLITYGDDLIMSVMERYIKLFNNLSLQKFFARYGIKFTDASKAGNRPYEECLSKTTFLKRSFVKHPHFENEMLSPLDEDVSIKDVVNWVRKNPDMHAATIQAVIDCNTNAYSLGPKRFEPIHNKLKTGLATLGVDVQLRSWVDLDRLAFTTYYGLKKDPKL